MCRPGYALSDCSEPCPGFDLDAGSLPCLGRGVCNEAQGTCACDPGYGGDNCSLPCPGGIESPCNYRGSCTPSATCICNQGSAGGTAGHYGGEACEHCAPGYFGAGCSDVCVNGTNNEDFTGCLCNRDYYGTYCDKPCPGLTMVYNDTTGDPLLQTDNGTTTVVPAPPGGYWVEASCHGHGQCAWGAKGTGLCTCEEDYFTKDCSVWCDKANCDITLQNA